jgi:hypothetical protein
MARVYKQFTSNDVTSTRTLLHESVPITGTIISGTYSDNNIKNYSHGMFQSVYDYPYLSSSANHIFDLTLGVSTGYSGAVTITSQATKKVNIYNELAQVLVGFDETGSVRNFDRDGQLATGSTHTDLVYFNFSRLLSKDEIKKGTFALEFMASSGYAVPASSALRIKVYDSGAADVYKTNSPAGEYGILYITNSAGSPVSGTTIQAGGASAAAVGLIYYQAGIAVINPVIIMCDSTQNINGNQGILSSSLTMNVGGDLIPAMITGSTIQATADALRNRLYNVSFNNTTEINSTVYFCRVNHNEFNYSSNPTYLANSKIRVKQRRSDPPVAYPTAVGLYSPDRELLAVGKLSAPQRKDPAGEFTLRVRLDY